MTWRTFTESDLKKGVVEIRARVLNGQNQTLGNRAACRKLLKSRSTAKTFSV